jgi:hypothetical protein
MLENYTMNEDGVVFQTPESIMPFTYNKQYVEERYDQYGEKNLEISALRLGYVVGALGFIPNSILDIGYGNGAFLKECKKIIPNCYGSDVSGYPLPDGVHYVDDWMNQDVDVLTFFDVLEHFTDPYVIEKAKAKYIVISLPWFHNHSDEWFNVWKHRRVNEHLTFFNADSMEKFAKKVGCTVLNITNIEDVVRPSKDMFQNILSVVLKKNE